MSRRISGLLTLVALGAVATTAVVAQRSQEPEGPPNVLVIVTDDQRARGTLGVMPAVRRWFAGEGTRFVNAFTTTPLCCPARSSILTGRYVHNHGVKHNVDSMGLDQSRTIPTLLQDEGYRTAIAGKFLNRWDPETAPPGFDRWAIFLAGEYYDRAFNIDGTVSREPDYTNEVVLRHALGFVDDFEENEDQPWFMYVGTGAAHAPFTAEPAYEDSPVPTCYPDPSVYEVDTSDKPDFIAQKSHRKYLRRKQLRVLMSADDLVESLFDRLEEAGELDNTIAVFMSDNGMLWGEHGFTGKRHPYSDSIKIPLFLRWPGHIDQGAKDERLVANIDIAPTVMDAVGVDAMASDGFSLLDDARREHLLVEHWGDEQTSIPDWASIRSLSHQYTEYYQPGGAVLFREYYDLERDPYQLRNRALGRTSPRMDRLHRRLARERECVDQTCP